MELRQEAFSLFTFFWPGIEFYLTGHSWISWCLSCAAVPATKNCSISCSI